MLKIGEFEIFPWVEGRFHLDGGAMFGIVPKTMWEKLLPPDDKNLVPLDTNLLLVKTKGKNVLIDSGLGDVFTDRERKIYAAYNPSNLEVGLTGFGVRPDQVDLVILSHLHADHACGTIKAENGKEMPRFKNAKVILQKAEWEDAVNPDERTAAGYLMNHLSVLEKYQALEMVQGDEEILPGIKVVKTGGHTEGHQGIEISSNGQKLIYYADIVPTSFHLKPHYVAGLDLHPRQTMQVKKKIIPEAIEQEWHVAFDHDLRIKVARLKKDSEGTIYAEPVVTS